jgi:hypothetical protein
VNVPLAEFVRAVDRVPHMVEPLCVKSRHGQRLVLVSSAERIGSSAPPVAIAVAPEHLVEPLSAPSAKASPGLPPPPRRLPLPPPAPGRPRPEGKGGP